jgi:hypothetical protein
MIIVNDALHRDGETPIWDWLPPARADSNHWTVKTIHLKEEEITRPSKNLQELPLPDGRTFWVAEDENTIDFWHPGLYYQLDLSNRRGVAQVSGLGAEQNVLRVLYFLELLHLGGLLLHAAGVVRHGVACIFPGVSGAGKTTIVRLSHGMPILSDELCALHWSKNNPVLAYGTPFYGEWNQPGEKLSTKVKGLFFLEKHSENCLTPLSSQETLTRLLPCVCTYTDWRPRLEKLIDLSIQLSERVPGYLLSFRPNSSLWEVIDAS